MKALLITILIIAVLFGCVWFSIPYIPGLGPGFRRPGARDVGALMKPLLRPAIRVTKSSETSRSYIGGAAPAFSGLVWPVRNGHALSFIACIDCSELPRSDDLGWLPREGVLLFFYDMIDEPWGLGPEEKGGHAVLYFPRSTAIASADAPTPVALPDKAVIPRRFLKFSLTKLPPNWEAPEVIALGLTAEETGSFSDLRGSLYGDQPHHQIGGYPDPVQSPDMEADCQLAIHGIPASEAGYKDPRVPGLLKNAHDWSLLFQVDTDDELKIMWGDAGMIYFWIRRDDARALKFDNTWVVLQCG